MGTLLHGQWLFCLIVKQGVKANLSMILSPTRQRGMPQAVPALARRAQTLVLSANPKLLRPEAVTIV
jgi:hypothetical protein